MEYTFYQCLIALIVSLLLASSSYAQSAETVQKEKSESAEIKEQVVSVGYVTLRNKTGNSDPADFFGGKRDQLKAGSCNVTFTGIPRLEEIVQSIPIYVPDETIKLTSVQETELETFLDEITLSADQNSRNIVLYFHGYNIDFEKSCRRSAILQRAIGLHDRLILFSWPSEGNAFKYTWDESDLVWSVSHITDFLAKVIERVGSTKIDVIGHSLGARGLIQAMTLLALQRPGIPLVHELILIAPDIDTGIFQQQYPLFRQSVNRFTLYLSENDKALKLSREVHGNPRLGEAGEYLTIVPGIETIDISGIKNRRLSGHLYHLFDSEVIKDLTLLLNSGDPASERPSLEKKDKEGSIYWRILPEDK